MRLGGIPSRDESNLNALCVLWNNAVSMTLSNAGVSDDTDAPSSSRWPSISDPAYSAIRRSSSAAFRQGGFDGTTCVQSAFLAAEHALHMRETRMVLNRGLPVRGSVAPIVVFMWLIDLVDGDEMAMMRAPRTARIGMITSR